MQRVLKIDDRGFNRQVIAGLVSLLALQILLVTSAFYTYARNETSGRWVDHTHEVIDTLADVQVHLERAEAASRGYLLAPAEQRAVTYRASRELVLPALEQVRELIRGDRAQSQLGDRLKLLVELELRDLDSIMVMASAGDRAGATRKFVELARAFRVNQARTITDAMQARAQSLLKHRQAEERISSLALKLVLGGAAFLVLLAAAFLFFVARRYIDDLSYARARLSTLNEDLEGEVKRRTAELLRANEEVQRFAYIVSHDLRSPLVNILGFTAELESASKTLADLITAAEAAAPKLITAEIRHAQEDLPEAIGFIRSATRKMDRLINAILRLSREGRRTLTPELLPMDLVLKEIAGSFSQSAEQAGATLTVEGPMPNITNDRVAIEQIFSNLVENAIKYLDPSRPGRIVIRGRQEGERALFEVEDNGRGIDSKDFQRVFELFRRSGVQDRPGEGIGLAQVRGLVNRLGGYIDVESNLGSGSIFRLNLPITYVSHGADHE